MTLSLAQKSLHLLGWKIKGELPKDLSKAVVIAAPHTSNWDFVWGQLALSAFRIRSRYFAKKELFMFPFSLFLKWTGAISVNRQIKQSLVKRSVDLFATMSELFLVITTEGTRSRVERWKTGFYYIAQDAKVPIILSYIDYGKKELGVGPLFYPTGDFEKDMTEIQGFYEHVVPRYPSLYNPVIF